MRCNKGIGLQGLSDGLLSQLQMRQMGKEYSLAWVHGVVAPVNTGKLPEILPAEASADEGLEGGVFIGAPHDLCLCSVALYNLWLHCQYLRAMPLMTLKLHDKGQ